MAKHLLVIGAQDSSVMKAALDAQVTLFQVPRLVSGKQIASAGRACVFDIESPREAVLLARAIHEHQPFDAVASFLDAGLLSAAHVAEALRIPGNSLQAVATTRDKLAVRKLLNDHGVSAVAFQRCDTAADVDRFLRATAGPIVLKPASGSGSSGVSKIDRESQIPSAFEWAKVNAHSVLIAEAYVDGPEYSVESLTRDGVHRIVAITEKYTTGAPHFIEIGHRLPAPIPQIARQRIEDLVTRVLSLIGHRVGVAHTELRITGTGNPVIIETQLRQGGGQIWEMVELACGVDMIRETCAYVLGLPPSPTAKKADAAAIGFLAHQHKTVREVRNLERAAMIPGVVRVDCRLNRGQRIDALTSAKSRQGYVIAVGETPAIAWETVQEALAEIDIEWEQ